MNSGTVVMVIIAVLLLGIAYIQGDGRHIEGARIGARTFLQFLPLLVAAFLIAGLVEVLIPKVWITRWLGQEAGYKGILIASALGTVTPGGPYVSFPIVASIYRAGAGMGSMVAYVSAWALLGLGKLPFELAIMGTRFTLIRYACTFIFPIIAGFLAHVLFSRPAQ
jgi:uncharacterized protein